MTVERGNLPNSERCGRSRSITGHHTAGSLLMPVRTTRKEGLQGRTTRKDYKEALQGSTTRKDHEDFGTTTLFGTMSLIVATPPAAGANVHLHLTWYFIIHRSKPKTKSLHGWRERARPGARDDAERRRQQRRPQRTRHRGRTAARAPLIPATRASFACFGTARSSRCRPRDVRSLDLI